LTWYLEPGQCHGSVPYGSSRVGRAQEADRGVVGKVVHTTQHFALGSTSTVGEEER